MTKVKVSREVAKEVEYAKEEFRYELSALKYLFMEAEIENDDDVALAIKAYINGYEIEETPEEKWSERYKLVTQLAEDNYVEDGEEIQYEVEKQTIEDIARDFGLKIEGVDAN